MFSGLPIIVAMTAQAAGGYGPALPPVPKSEMKAPVQPCKTTEPKDVHADTQEIVVCAERVEGYRIDPDVLEAKRHSRNRTPKRPERLVDNSCASVGPMGCMGQTGINVLAAAVTAATMLEKAITGQNVGKMFVTDPQPTEYELYKEAKRIREAKEAEELAAGKAKAEASASATQPK